MSTYVLQHVWHTIRLSLRSPYGAGVASDPAKVEDQVQFLARTLVFDWLPWMEVPYVQQ